MASIIGSVLKKHHFVSKTAALLTPRLATGCVQKSAALRLPFGTGIHRFSNLSAFLHKELTEERETGFEMPEELATLHEEMKQILTLRETDLGSGSIGIVAHMKNPPPGEKITVEFAAGLEDGPPPAFDDAEEEPGGALSGEGGGGADEEGGDDDELGDLPSEKEFAVTVAKGEERLRFYCRALDSVAVDAVQHIRPGQDPDAPESYEGPNFDDLDPDLQGAFLDYLAARGVGDDLGAWVVMYADYREQREYVGWLESVKGFVDK